MAKKENQPEKSVPIQSSTDGLRGQITREEDGKLKAPINIIQTVTAAKTLYYKYRFEALRRIELYARIEGLIAGNPPYNPVELDRHGLSHISNFNNLDGRALYERGALAYWNLLNEAETLCKFYIHDMNPEAPKVAATMAKNWDYVVRKWPSFYTQVNTLSAQIIKFGLSPVIWPDERDWRWRTVELSRFFITDQAQADVERLTSIFVETTFTVQYLFEVYNEFKDVSKKESPWNIEELEKFLLFRANRYVKDRGQEIINLMDLQLRLQNGDLRFDGLFTDSVRLVSLLQQEYENSDGKSGVSHYLFDSVYDHGNFLYFVDKQYKEIQEALVIFTASPGEFTLHSNRGLGHKIFAGCQAMMQLDCSIVDSAKWASTIFLKSLATGSKDIEAIRFVPGAPTNIGTAEFVQNNFGSNISQLIGASQYINQKLQYNTANSGDDPGVPDRNYGSISPTQARMESYREFGVLKHNIAHFYSQFDIVIRNMVAKMLHSKKGYPGYEYAKEWKDRCLEDGVPEEMFSIKDESEWGLPRQLDVKATRVAGDGSTLGLLMGLQELGPISANFGPKASAWYERKYVMATMGKDEVEAFTSENETPDEMAGGASLAGLENIAMRQGESPVFSLDNEHRSHFITHMALAKDTIEQLGQQQTDPVEADKIFNVLLPHVDEHFQALQRSPFNRNFVQSIAQSYNQFKQYATLNRKNASSMLQAELKQRQKDEQNQQKAMSEEELNQFTTLQDEKRKDFKIQSQVTRAARANENRADVMRDKVKMDADNQRLKIHLENSNKIIDNKSKLDERSTEELRGDINTIQGATISPNDIELQ